MSEQTAVEVVDEPAHYSSASISDEAIKAGNETATMKNMDDLKELMQKFLPGDRVRVTHSIWPKNLNNGRLLYIYIAPNIHFFLV